MSAFISIELRLFYICLDFTFMALCYDSSVIEFLLVYTIFDNQGHNVSK